MSRSGICSDMRSWEFRILAAFVMGLTLSLATAQPSLAKVLLTQEQALALAFPKDAEPERVTSYLTDEQAARIKKEAGEAPPSNVLIWYKEGDTTAWFETHVVRTRRETIMIVVGGDGGVSRVDLLAFSEPDEYRPSSPWLQQFTGGKEGADLSLRGRIRPITGATLSARAIVAAVRRALAARRILAVAGDGDGAEALP